MGTVYSSTKIKDQHTDFEHPLSPDIYQILSDAAMAENPQCAYEKQKYYWDEWNTAVGAACKDDYEIFVEMSNKAAVANGGTDTGRSWRGSYEDEFFQQHLEETWSGTEGKRGVKDLYRKIHGYMR